MRTLIRPFASSARRSELLAVWPKAIALPHPALQAVRDQAENAHLTDNRPPTTRQYTSAERGRFAVHRANPQYEVLQPPKRAIGWATDSRHEQAPTAQKEVHGGQQAGDGEDPEQRGRLVRSYRPEQVAQSAAPRSEPR